MSAGEVLVVSERGEVAELDHWRPDALGEAAGAVGLEHDDVLARGDGSLALTGSEWWGAAPANRLHRSKSSTIGRA